VLWISACWFTNAWAQVAVRIPDSELDVQDIAIVNDSQWLATTTGAYQVKAGHATRIPDLSIPANKIALSGEDVWLATSIGAYRIRRGDTKRIPDRILNVLSVSVITNQVWLATADGAYVSDGENIKAIGPPGELVQAISNDGNTFWLGTDRGAYKIDSNGTPVRVTPEPVFVSSIASIKSEVWIATPHGAFRVKSDGTLELLGQELNVRQVSEVNGEIWLATSTGAYRISGKLCVRSPDLELSVEDITQIDNDLWLSTSRGAYRIRENQITTFPGEAAPVKRVVKINGGIWLLGYHGAFLVHNDRAARIPNVDLEAQQVIASGDDTWMATSLGSFEVKNLNISIQVKNSDSWWKWLIDKLSPWPVLVDGDASVDIRYIAQDGSTVSSDQLIDPNFVVVQEFSKPALEKSIHEGRSSPASGFLMKLASGKRDLYFSVRDKWGNTAEAQMGIWVLPGPLIISIAVPIFWLCILAVMIGLAPVSESVNTLLMNPWLRNVSSFGLIPLTLSVSASVRRHMLKRYIGNLRNDKSFAEWLQRYQMPDEQFSAFKFGERLSKERVLQVTGQSGIGKTSFLKYLTAAYANGSSLPTVSNNASQNLPSATDTVAESHSKYFVPVFVPLVRYQGQKADEMVAAQLASYGSLTDRQIVAWYIQQGEFLFLFDGLNEVDEGTRSEINRFVDLGRRKNLFCVSSQETYPAMAWIAAVKMSYLTSENVKEIVVSSLGMQAAKAALSQFKEATFVLYKVPQDLEFLIQMCREHPETKVPQSKSQLYDCVLNPVFEKWNEEGRNDFAEVLAKRAYEMIKSRDPLLSGTVLQFPGELTSPLLFKKLLVQRDDKFYFQHNLVRDYLGSIYLQTDWRALLKDETTVDSNWVEMLKFLIARFEDSRPCKDMLYLLIDKNRRIAGELFNWLQSERPDLSRDWSAEFKVKLAESLLGTPGSNASAN
jgi:hypothetical protein